MENKLAKRKSPFWHGYLLGISLTGVFLFYLSSKNHVFPKHDYTQLVVSDLKGNPVNLAIFDSKPMVINYWAIWCKPCIEEFSNFEAVRKNTNGRVVFIMISDDPPEKIEKYLKGKPYGFIFLRSNTPLNLNVRPVTHFYNKNRNLVYQQIGSIDDATLGKLINKIL